MAFHFPHASPHVYEPRNALVSLYKPRRGQIVRLPEETSRLIQLVRHGRGGGLFPRVGRLCPEGVIKPRRLLSGSDDAERLALTLAQPEFLPLVDSLEALAAWCRDLDSRHADLFDPGVMALDNTELFGSLISEIFLHCAARGSESEADVRLLQQGFMTFCERFVTRFSRDLQAGVFRGAGLSVPIVGLWADSSETHNGRQQVLRVRLFKGPSIAYKPRPVNGEKIFLAENSDDGVESVFSWINSLPAASGKVRLPTLRVWQGRSRDRQAYSWQEWISQPRQWGTIRECPRLRLEAPRLRPRQAEQYWHRAGSLAMTALAFGISDLGEGNVLAGTRSGAPEPQLYPIDIESFFCSLCTLQGTGLIEGNGNRGTHHVGFESQARWCSVDGPKAVFLETRAGVLHLHRVRMPWARQQTQTVIADTNGNIGYANYLLPLLRGMFDLWTVVNLNRDELLEHVRHATHGHHIRVLTRFTSTYFQELDRRLQADNQEQAESGQTFSPEEEAQFARLDVPYFFCDPQGDSLLWIDGTRIRPARPQGLEDPAVMPSQEIMQGENISFINLGIALRDVIEYVYPQLSSVCEARGNGQPGFRFCDSRWGVDVSIENGTKGKASFDWPEADQRLTYIWDGVDIRLRLEELPAKPRLNRELRRQLLRIDRIDGEIRSRWVKTHFSDRELQEQLTELTLAGADWLREVIDEYGWPGQMLVGKRAAEAACRLVQHIEKPSFQRRCLRLIREAASKGEVPWRHVAYLTDTLRVQSGRKQRFGTKFERRNDELVPYPIEYAASVDRRRREMGLEPLHSYAKRVNRTFLKNGN